MRVPQNLSEITIDKYIKAIDIIENEDVELVVMLRLLNLFTGKSIEQLVEYPLAELDKNYQHIAKVLNEKPKFQKTFFLEGKEYGFIPNLEQMKSGEYIDLTNNLGKDILASMAVMYRPITRKFKDVYDIEKYNGTDNKEVFKNAPISVYLGAQVFFLEFNERLVETYSAIFGKGTNSGANSGFGEKWGWFIAIKRIGREYRLTPSEVVERFNINEFLTEIEYLDDEYKEQEKQIKNAKRNI